MHFFDCNVWDKWRGPFRGGGRLCSPAWAGGVDEVKGAVQWGDQRAGYPTMEEQAYRGRASTIRGMRRSPKNPPPLRGGRPRTGNPRRRPWARGTRPGCLAAVDRVLPHDLTDQRPDRSDSVVLRRQSLGEQPKSDSPVCPRDIRASRRGLTVPSGCLQVTEAVWQKAVHLQLRADSLFEGGASRLREGVWTRCVRDTGGAERPPLLVTRSRTVAVRLMGSSPPHRWAGCAGTGASARALGSRGLRRVAGGSARRRRRVAPPPCA